MRIALVSLWVMFLAAAPAIQAQPSITVHFVDFKSGKPIKRFYMVVEAWCGGWNGTITKHTKISFEKYSKHNDGKVTVPLRQCQSKTETNVFEVSTRTDSDGKLIVNLPESLPDYLRISSFELSNGISDFPPLKFSNSEKPCHPGRNTTQQFADQA